MRRNNIRENKLARIDIWLSCGTAEIVGQTSDQHLLGTGFWIIQDDNDSTIHVPIADRPQWYQYWYNR